MQSHAGSGRVFVFGEEKRGGPCRHLSVFGGLWNSVREEKISVYKAIQWDSAAKDGKRSRDVCYLKCFISMSKSIVFLFLPSRFPTMHGHQGFVYGRETRGIELCYQFVCSNLHIVHTVTKLPFRPSFYLPTCLSYYVPPNQRTIERITDTKAFLFGEVTPGEKILVSVLRNSRIARTKVLIEPVQK